jgi:hypothetical protein
MAKTTSTVENELYYMVLYSSTTLNVFSFERNDEILAVLLPYHHSVATEPVLKERTSTDAKPSPSLVSI